MNGPSLIFRRPGTRINRSAVWWRVDLRATGAVVGWFRPWARAGARPEWRYEVAAYITPTTARALAPAATHEEVERRLLDWLASPDGQRARILPPGRVRRGARGRGRVITRPAPQ